MFAVLPWVILIMACLSTSPASGRAPYRRPAALQMIAPGAREHPYTQQTLKVVEAMAGVLRSRGLANRLLGAPASLNSRKGTGGACRECRYLNLCREVCRKRMILRWRQMVPWPGPGTAVLMSGDVVRR